MTADDIIIRWLPGFQNPFLVAVPLEVDGEKTMKHVGGLMRPSRALSALLVEHTERLNQWQRDLGLPGDLRILIGIRDKLCRCSHCDEWFWTRTWRQAWCSERCSRESHRANLRERVARWRAKHATSPEPRDCAHCETTFTPARRDARFCSTRCRVAAHRKR